LFITMRGSLILNDQASEHPREDPHDKILLSSSTPYVFVSLSVLAAACAALRIVSGWWAGPGLFQSIDSTTLLYVAAAAVLLRFNDLESAAIGGNSVRFRRLERKVEVAEKKADEANRTALLVLPEAAGGKPALTKEASAMLSATSDTEDPQRGRWGGQASRNNRRLWAKIEPLAGTTEYFNVHIQVESTSESDPLRGKVIFHLHPTFRKSVVEQVVRNGIAAIDRVAYGAFTVGAETDNGPLELNLADVPGSPVEFRER
jgi:hypothetical protein